MVDRMVEKRRWLRDVLADIDMTEDEFDRLWEQGEPVEVIVGPEVARPPQ